MWRCRGMCLPRHDVSGWPSSYDVPVRNSGGAGQTEEVGLNESLEDLVRGALQAEKSGDATRAVEALERALTLDSANAVIWRWLGRLHIEGEQYSAARDALDKALLLDPMSASAHAFLGLVRLRLRQLEEAAESFACAVQIDPCSDYHVFLADAYTQLGKDAQAEQALRDAIALDPDNEEALLNLALEVRGDEPGEAIELLRKAIQVDPTFAKAHRELGYCLGKMGLPSEGEESLRVSLDLDGDDPWTYVYLAELIDGPSRRPEAEQLLSKACEVAPLLSFPHRRLAALYAEDGRLGEAESEYRAAIATDPDDVGSILAFAEHLLEWGRAAEAHELAMSALRINPDHSEARALVDRTNLR